MDELVFRFLLDSGYPRASLVSDFDFLPLAGSPDNGRAAMGGARPDYAVLDPDTLERLAVFKAVPALDEGALRTAAEVLAGFAQRFGGKMVQGFLVRIDPDAATEQDAVQFFRVWPNSSLEYVAAHAVPDLQSLRVRMQLARLSAHDHGTPEAREPDDDEFEAPAAPGPRPPLDDPIAEPRASAPPTAFVWVPGALLAILAITDGLTAGSLLSLEQTVLVVAAAALLCWVMLVRR